MKSLVVYSSLTGNTKLIAEAIATVMPEGTELVSVKKAPDPQAYDVIALGFWNDKGAPDAAMLRYMEKVQGQNKKIGLFGTLGAYPDSEHAASFMQKGADMVKGNEVIASFVCQGKIDPKLLSAMAKMPEAQKVHPMTEERKKRIEVASTHPDAQDCENAKACFSEAMKKLGAA